MSNRNFVVDLNISLDGLHGYPGGSTPAQVFQMMMMQFMLAWSKQGLGSILADQRMFFKVRKAMEDAIKVGDTTFNLEPEEYAFIDKVRHEVKLEFEANEAIMRVNEQLDKARENYEKKYGKDAVIKK
jgi:hypothetical protein